MFIPRKVKRGKGFAEYIPGVRTKAAELKRGLKVAIALGKERHVEWIDFIPSVFTLQIHLWFDTNDETGYTKLSQIEKQIKSALKRGADPIKELRGKAHYDLRIQKRTAPSWFGVTLFRAPWTGVPENKVMSTLKGYAALSPGGPKLQRFLREFAERQMATEGISERRDRLEWLKVKSQWFPKGSPGNPQKNQDAAMVAIEFYKPCVLHRRDFDFFDVTFFGKYLKGRYYGRLVEVKKPESELTQAEREKIKSGKAKAIYVVNFYFWKAKKQWGDPGTPYTMEDVRKAALLKKTLDMIPAPPRKD